MNHVVIIGALGQKSIVSLIECVLSLEEADVGIYLSPLTSLLEVHDNNSKCYISFHHLSLMDFLHSQEQSKDYYVDDRTSHTLVAQWVLQGFTHNSM